MSLVVPSRLRLALRETVGGLPTTFWWLWTSTLVNRLGSFVVTFLALYLTAVRGFSPAIAGLVLSAYGLGGVGGALLGGLGSDRWGRRPTLVAAQSLAAVSTVLLGYTRSLWLIALFAALLGVTSNAARPAIQAIMADLVPARDRVRAFSLNYWAINIGFAVSASVAGALAANGFLILFWGDAIATFLCALVVFLRIPETRPERSEATTDKKGDDGDISMGTVFRDGPFMALVGLTFLIAMIVGLGQVALPVVMGRQGFSAQDFGLVIAVNGVLIVLGQIPATRLLRNSSRTGILVSAALLYGGGIALSAFAGGGGAGMAFYALTVAIWTIGEIIWTPANQAMVAALSPVHGRGRYQGVFSLAWQTSSFLSPLAAGAMLAGWGADSVWGACAALGALGAIGYVALMRGRAGRRTQAAEAAHAAQPVATSAEAEAAAELEPQTQLAAEVEAVTSVSASTGNSDAHVPSAS